MTYCELCCVSLVSGVQLFDVILGVLDDDLVWVAIELEHNGNEVLLAIFYPPACEL